MKLKSIWIKICEGKLVSSPFVFRIFLLICSPRLGSQFKNWRGAGVAELARLESVCTAKRYRGFESPSLRRGEIRF